MWRSGCWRLGTWLCCPRSGLRAPVDSGRRSLVSCIDRKAHPGEQVFGTRARAVVSAPMERSVTPRRSAPPSPSGPHPLLPAFPFTLSAIPPGSHPRLGSSPWPISHPPGWRFSGFPTSSHLLRPRVWSATRPLYLRPPRAPPRGRGCEAGSRNK